MNNPPKSRFLRDMVDRGFFNQCTDLAGLDAALGAGPITAYAGFDATARSLHVGHLVTLMAMRRLAADGHNVIALVGGATSRVGDPSFRNTSRPLMDDETVDANMTGIAFDIRGVLGENADRVTFVDNSEWLGGVGFLDFMRDVGSHFTVARMLAMDSVKSRLDDRQPLSALEFSYMMLQAADFAHLAKARGCVLQIGGSDQWGNIVNGIELARRRDGRTLFGLTTRLLTTADGTKMGKTAEGAVWLSGDKLAPFDFWQFWRNTADRDVRRFLLMFSDLPEGEVAAITGAGVDINIAKVRLADAVTTVVHGPDEAARARSRASALFEGGSGTEPTHRIAVGDGMLLSAAMVDLGMAPSKSEARRLIDGGAVRMNGERIGDAGTVLTAGGDPVRLSVGKRRRAVVMAI